MVVGLSVFRYLVNWFLRTKSDYPIFVTEYKVPVTVRRPIVGCRDYYTKD